MDIRKNRYAVSSKDPWLLARMVTDYTLHTGESFSLKRDVFAAGVRIITFHCSPPDVDFDGEFENWGFIPVTLTASNYIETLTEILAI